MSLLFETTQATKQLQSGKIDVDLLGFDMSKKPDDDGYESYEQYESKQRQQKRNRWQSMFTNKIVGPLVIGVIVYFVGEVVESDPIIYMGTGIHMFGWFMWIKELF